MDCPHCTYNHCAKRISWPLEHREIMVVGDIPMPMEVRRNTIMTGPAVEMLRQTMEKVGLPTTDDKVVMTTAIKCAVPKKKGKAVPVEIMKNCHFALREEIKSIAPKLLLVLGKTATITFLGDTKAKVTSMEGRICTYDDLPGTEVMFLKHPAAIISAPGDFKNFYGGLVLAAQIFNGEALNDAGITNYKVLRTEEEVDEAIKFLQDLQTSIEVLDLGADMETTSLDYRVAEPLVFGIAYDKNEVFVIPRHLRHRLPEFWLLQGMSWVWQNGKYDAKVLWRRNLGWIPINHDTQYMHYVLNETPPHDLGFLTKTFLQAKEYKYKMNQEFKNVTLETYDQYFDALCERVAVDADYTRQLKYIFMPKIEEESELLEVYTTLMIKAANFTRRVERNGIAINDTHFEEMSVKYKAWLLEILDEVKALADVYWDYDLYCREAGIKSPKKIAPPFNPGSPKQMSWMVFKRLQLKPRIRQGTSTNADVLESIEPKHPLIDKVLQFRRVQKEHSTYVLGMLKAVDREGDNRIHCNFQHHITATGRLSCKEPNLQNIPSAFGVGNIRRGFIPGPGKLFMEVDYSGAELRWAAFLSKCPELTKVFVEGLNLHDVTAVKVFGPNFTKQDRMRAKAYNFGILFGRQAHSFVDEFNMTLEEAQEQVQAWLDGYPGVRDYLNDCAMAVLEGRYLTSAYGRRRRFGLVSAATLVGQQNEARNFPVQSPSSDTLTTAAMYLEEPLLEYDTIINDLIHDSMLLEAPARADIVQKVGQMSVEHMKKVPNELFGCTLPFECDIDLGPTWGDMVPYSYKTGMCEIKGEGEIPLSEMLIRWGYQEATA